MFEDLVWDGKPYKRPCNGCGSDKYSEMRTIIEDTELVDACDQCSHVRADGIPDVYLGHIGQKFQNLIGKDGQPIEIRSKRHKKQVMDEMGVSEAGHTVNGAPYGSKSWIEGTRAYRKKNFKEALPAIRETYRQYLNNARKKR
jgi:hypothetical protein